MRLKFSCIVDDSPLFRSQAYINITSLIDLCNVNPGDIYVHIVYSGEDDLIIYLKKNGINIIRVSPFDSRNPYCNKLQQLSTFRQMEDFDYVFLMDCDTAVVSLEGLQLQGKVHAKIVDFPNPPLPLLEDIFEAAGMPEVTHSSTSFSSGDSCLTDHNNANGGLYIIRRDVVAALEESWRKYALWSLDNIELYTPRFQKHADQVSFALALGAMNIKMEPLDIRWNYPTHIQKELLPDIEPNILHFHTCLDNHMRLETPGLPSVDRQIKKVNSVLSHRLSNSLDNSLFWNFRYHCYPELGSGVGSRGNVLAYKRKLIEYASFPFKDRQVIDVGSGDLELTKELPFTSYLGLDVSSEAIATGKAKRPDWDFINKSIWDKEVEAGDLVICFDVLIHQSSPEDFKNLLWGIMEKVKTRIIIGAYEKAPKYSSDITYYYNNILEEVCNSQKFDEIGVIGKYRDISVIVASRHTRTHERDISSDSLNFAFRSVERPGLLQFLVDVSRHYFGFFTSHFPRVFEYSWLLGELEDLENLKVLDIGAGVCPLPLCLEELGHSLITIDAHSQVRSLEDMKDWNEWGFLDYSNFRPGIKSYNMNFLDYKEEDLLDVIYSISVIEHLPKKDRKEIIKKSARMLKKEGLLLLTVDLIPGTNSIWNLSEEIEVEPLKEHGKVKTLKKELRRAGFTILEEKIQREIKDSLTDVYYIKAKRRKKLFGLV